MKRHIAVSLLLCGLLNAEALSPTCYRDNDKNVVICSEKKLGRLMWQDGDLPSSPFGMHYDKAIEYCENLNFAGFDDWRLPTINELLSITDDTRVNPAINKAFKNVAYVTNYKGEKSYGLYWSSTKSASGGIWFVDFSLGDGSWSDFSGHSFVRCVRQY